jgi:mannose-6-phosphate isomerase-like protein (cupin superfamily)
MNTASQILEGFKPGPSIEMSTWYKGILTSQLATDQETGGAFDIVMSYMRSGAEPPPHVREREHEFFYVLEGELEVFIADKCFRVSKGECLFSQLVSHHAFKILSP